MSKFTHLHVHSHFSLLNALPQIPDLVKAAKSDGQAALALTDNGNLYGAIEFYKECKKKEIKPILGIDAYMAARSRTDKQHGIDNRRTRLVLLAENENGYKNLIKLVTYSHLEGFYYKPRIDKELLEKYKGDLICIAPSFSSEISQALKHDDFDKAKELATYYKNLFGPDRFYLEISHHPEIPNHMDLMEKIQKLTKQVNVPVVAAHDVYYLKQEDRGARNVLLSIQQTGDPGERGFDDAEDDFSLITQAQAEEYFKDIPEALESTEKIVGMCNMELELGKWKFPNYIVPSGLSYDDELRRIVEEGMKHRGIQKTDEIEKRVEYELEVIKKKGYAAYFLVVADLLKYAHDHGILTTIRGSVAGSLVTYLAEITNVNPLEYKLPFERFLNPERPSAPDIDMDYADNRRDEMIEYAKKKYGYDKVAQIGTFGTMMARGAVRDTARAMGYPYGLGDRIAKLIPMGAQGFPMTIDRAMEMEAEIKKMYDTEQDVREIIDMAKKIEGCARHISIHAAGVVISPIPLTDVVPLQLDPKGENKVITQYDMHAVGEDNAGLLKFDFLGIKNLSILADAVKLVKQIEKIDVDIENVPLDDPKTFKLLARGETIGLFQLNGTGMTRFLKELKPTTIHDINAMVALYRPGPMESIPQYIERKHNSHLVQYLDPRLRDILDQSYGVITYQDDVMMISIKLAGYSWLKADKLRKAMGKKIPEVMQAEKEELLKGFAAGGLSKEKGDKLWSLIEPFAAYGFNKAHAASYGKVAYQTAYMKANFPAIYMSAVLTADSGDVEEISAIIAECKRMKIPVLPPDVNESYAGFTVVKNHENSGKDAIRFGLSTIKNFGVGVADSIIAERKQNGPFTSIGDFLRRIKDKNLNRKSLESLVKCGALDTMGERGMLMGNIEKMLEYHKERSRGNGDQTSLWGGMAGAEAMDDIRIDPAMPASMSEKLAWEKELLGLYISGHPLDKHQDILSKVEMDISVIKQRLRDGMQVKAFGILEEVRVIMTKGGDKMAFLKLADKSGSIETVAFPKVFKEFSALINPETCIGVKGRISMRNGTISILAEKMKGL